MAWTARRRLGLFVIGLGGMFMALAVPGAYNGRGVLFGASYLAVRVVLLIMDPALPAGCRMVNSPWSRLVSGPLL